MASKSLKKKPNRKRSRAKSFASMASYKHLYLRIFILISIILLVCGILVLGVSSNTWIKISSDNLSIQLYGYQVVNEFPHDPSAFTQGLVYAGNDTLFESTGLYKQSSVRKVALKTGKVEILHKMADSYFGEGLTLLGERLFQVTWLTNIGFIYDRKKLQQLEQFTHQMEDGWGLATDGKILYGSDGTSTLYHIDPQTLKVTRKHVIKFNGHDVRYLNELEYINGEIWANVWQTDCIARISPNNGTMLGWIILQPLREGLIAAGHNGIDVLNGIAWDSNNNRIFDNFEGIIFLVPF
ncbi:glutaminyl-peptide cyclotransferase-like isoform X2 [Durio zibethinus]|uniref:Glutaminyl-peptide cyclotransferase-like isoform X2 n=1 Tax=Durio zibethinus TaxID=66656 RepID=A0A6P5Y645_DURZI|nr:glutaminyl-peptide cyclotransferase-like isoform X2 [Durio zibethinus]